MKRILFAAGAFALVVGLAIGQDRGRQDDRRKDANGFPPASQPDRKAKAPFGQGEPFPGQPDLKGSPFAQLGFSGRLSPASARRLLPQYEEELELFEAQRDIRKAHVRAAEVMVKSAETQFVLLDRPGNKVPQIERTKARLEVDAAQAQLEIKIAEMKEVEVRIKHSKKRLEDAKAAAAAPLPERDGRFDPRIDPPPPKGGLRNEDRGPGDGRPALGGGQKRLITEGEKVVSDKKARLAEAMAVAEEAQARLVRIREIARQGRAAAAEVEAAEARDQEAQIKVEKARVDLKKAQDALDGARKEKDDR